MNKSSNININTNLRSNCSLVNNQNLKDFSQYDIQKLSYQLIKEYSHLKIDKNERFMERMLFDIYKRQSKDDRLNKMIDKNSIKMDESERIKAFNRLIEDANRRMDVFENIEQMKTQLEDKPVSDKKYKEEDWNEVYKERYFHLFNILDFCVIN